MNLDLRQLRDLIDSVTKLASRIGVSPTILLVTGMYITIIVTQASDWSVIGAFIILAMFVVQKVSEANAANHRLEMRRLDLQQADTNLAIMKRPRRAKIQSEQPTLPLGVDDPIGSGNKQEGERQK